MHGFALAAIGAFSAVHARFNREKDSGVDRFFDLPCEIDETIKVVLIPERIELLMNRSPSLGKDIKPE